MKLATRIFRREDWYVTSKFGWRIDPISKETKFHTGTDYGTRGGKWPQYALEDGIVEAAGKDSTKAIYAWVKYPRLSIRILHYHLDKVFVKKGDKVNADTIIGNTGTTGYSTGVHLHLSLTKIGNATRLDPHIYEYEEDHLSEFTDEELAHKVWAGEFGNGEDRKKALGSRYAAVQGLVNKGVGKPEEEKSESLKVGDIVEPTRLVGYTGKTLVRYDKNYVLTELSGDRAVLKAQRGGKLITWAAINVKNIKKVK